MGKLKRFEEAEVWQSARILVRSVYSFSRCQPFSTDYALREQIRRASVSIASNIAEGFDSQSNPTFCRFLASARGSVAEVQAQLYIALDLGYLSETDFALLVSLCESVGRQLTGFIAYLKRLTEDNQESGIRNQEFIYCCLFLRSSPFWFGRQDPVWSA
jgi:four helix bundle protein